MPRVHKVHWVHGMLGSGIQPNSRLSRRFSTDPADHGGRDAGLDVMGDGAVIAYRGGINREPLDADTLDDAFELVREALSA